VTASIDGDADERVVPRRRRTALWASIVLGALLVGLVVVLATRPSALDKQSESPLLGKPAPDISGTSVISGQAVSLVGLRGRWVVVNFFATWCIPCRQEHPEFVKFAQRHLSGDAQVLMVIYDDSADKVRAWFRAKGGDWPVVADPGGRVALDFGVSGVPETYLVDPNGFLVSKTVGGVTADGLDRLLGRARAQGA
jgi:cytochrome c biogenesis protein CcmG/thiol:disulfide interchange protein DsbE